MRKAVFFMNLFMQYSHHILAGALILKTITLFLLLFGEMMPSAASLQPTGIELYE
jgi:hypothetical protein